MEFNFNCEQLFTTVDSEGLTILSPEDPKTSSQKQNLSQVLDQIGVASSKVKKTILKFLNIGSRSQVYNNNLSKVLFKQPSHLLQGQQDLDSWILEGRT